jgi:hypothetical protein
MPRRQRRSSTTNIYPFILAALTGCTVTGTGFGSSSSGTESITFRWRSADTRSGTMSAVSSDGTHFTGRYIQIARNTPITSVAPLFDGWKSGWDETDWNLGASPEFIQEYTGRVVGNLASSSGLRMRCEFRLSYPPNGMRGGGRGRCQMSNGNTIEASFPPA